MPRYGEAPIGFGSLFGKNARLAGGPAPVRAYLEDAVARSWPATAHMSAVPDVTADARPIIHTRAGLVRGDRLGGVIRFLGIPYAQWAPWGRTAASP